MAKDLKKLPDAEFEVMKQVWEMEASFTAPGLMERMEEKDWKLQTLISLLIRLTDRGFLSTEKRGRERLYRPLVEKEEYLAFETRSYVKDHHGNSISSLMAALFDGGKPKSEDLNELEDFLKNWEKGGK